MIDILITGSEGSLAQWVIKQFGNQYSIVGIDNFSRYGRVEKSRDYVLCEGDLCDVDWVNSVFEKYKPKYVLHCAAQIYGVVGFHKYSADILAGNAVSTHSILSAAVKHGTEKVAYLSSSMVYERATEFPLVESMTDSLPCPHTGYGMSKLFGEKLVEEYHKQYGLNYVIWRPFNIVTPLEVAEEEPGIAHVFADFIKKIVVEQKPAVEIFGNGEQIRCFTWIDDIARTIAMHSWSSITDQQAYNLGSEEPTKVIDLAKMIWSKSGRTDEFKADFVFSYTDDVLIRIPSSEKAQTQLEFTITKTVADLVETCLDNIPKK